MLKTRQAVKWPRLDGRLLVAVLVFALLCSCKKKEEEPTDVPMPARVGAASADIVETGIGTGLGLDPGLAGTGTKWTRVIVVNDTTAVIIGEALDQTIALRTTNSGKTWMSLTAAEKGWVSWGVDATGAVILAAGERAKVEKQKQAFAPVVKGHLWFADSDAKELMGPAPFFPGEKELKGATVPKGLGKPAVVAPDLGSLVLDDGGRAVIAYGAPIGSTKPEPRDVKGGAIVPVPYGLPPSLLTVAGSKLEARPWPKPGEELQEPSPVPGLQANSTVLEQLAAGPGCEAGEMSFQRVTPSPQNAFIVGVANNRSVAFKLPVAHETSIGCGPEAIVFETTDPKQQKLARKQEEPIPILVRCTLDGNCTYPENHPFGIWPEKHERKIIAVATKKGVVATMEAKSGTRWGVYLAQSLDGGANFELNREIGAGKTDRGFMEVGALVRLPTRLILLISAEVTGTSRRGWYVLVSDDDGTSWKRP